VPAGDHTAYENRPEGSVLQKADRGLVPEGRESARWRLEEGLMGYYVPGPTVGKAEFLVKEEGARQISLSDAERLADSIETAVICVVYNEGWEAALYAFNTKELWRTKDPNDRRPRRYLAMDRARAETLTGGTDG